MARRYKSRLFTKGHRYTVTHGQVVIPSKTHRGALKTAVAEVKQWGNVVHVLERSGRSWTTIATCIPEPPGTRARPRVVKCHLKKKPAKEKR